MQLTHEWGRYVVERNALGRAAFEPLLEKRVVFGVPVRIKLGDAVREVLPRCEGMEPLSLL